MTDRPDFSRMTDAEKLKALPPSRGPDPPAVFTDADFEEVERRQKEARIRESIEFRRHYQP